MLAKKLKVFDITLSEWKNMQNNGWEKIYDCGNDIFLWELASSPN